MADLLVNRHDPVAVLTLNRPQHGNRLTTSLANDVAAALEAARHDEGVCAVVLTGEGEAFCIGGDYAGAGPTAAGRKDYADALLRMDRAMAGLGKPLIAAVNGDAHAGGFAMVIACDMAMAADDATFGLPEAAKGLFPFVALAIVKDALPKKLLFDLVYSARLMNAAEARAAYVINEVVPRSTVLDRAIDLAAKGGCSLSVASSPSDAISTRCAANGRMMPSHASSARCWRRWMSIKQTEVRSSASRLSLNLVLGDAACRDANSG
jgi:enoyl-CoA hydratase/carnithine racemase